MSVPLGFSTSDIGDAYLVFYTLGGQELACIGLGIAVAYRTTRSVFVWILVGFICGLLPLVGIPLMLFALAKYPQAPPTYVSRSRAAQRANAERQREPSRSKRPQNRT